MLRWKRVASVVSGHLVVGGLLLVGCGTAQPAPSSPPTESGNEKQYGGVLHAASNPEPTGLYWFDAVAAGSGGHRTSLTPIFENLVTYQFTQQGDDFQSRGIAGHLAPALAESWTQTDPKTYRFTLRSGVKWHDGEGFSSKDVRWSLERWGDPPAAVDIKTLARNIESIETGSPTSVQVRLKEPDPLFLTRLADYGPKILPAHPAEKAGATGDALKDLYNQSAIGTGPFRFRSFTRTKSFEVERYDGYWSGKPHLDGVRVLYGIDRSTQQAAFIAGELDFISLNDKVQFDLVQNAVPAVQKVSYLGDNTPGVFLNLTRPPLNDVRVRRALHLALNRQEIVGIVTFGEGAVAAPPPVIVSLSRAGVGMKPEDYLRLPGWRENKEQDLAEARRLLAEAGASGLQLGLKYRRGAGTPVLLAEPTAAGLKAIGVDVSVIPLEDGVFVAQVDRDKDFELNVNAGGAGPIPAESAYNRWHSTSPGNISGIKDAELDRLVEQARSETDQTRLNETLTRIQRVIIDNVYYLPLINVATFQALQPWVHDFYGSFSSSVSLLNAQATWFDVQQMPPGRRAF